MLKVGSKILFFKHSIAINLEKFSEVEHITVNGDLTLLHLRKYSKLHSISCTKLTLLESDEYFLEIESLCIAGESRLNICRFIKLKSICLVSSKEVSINLNFFMDLRKIEIIDGDLILLLAENSPIETIICESVLILNKDEFILSNFKVWISNGYLMAYSFNFFIMSIFVSIDGVFDNKHTKLHINTFPRLYRIIVFDDSSIGDNIEGFERFDRFNRYSFTNYDNEYLYDKHLKNLVF